MSTLDPSECDHVHSRFLWFDLNTIGIDAGRAFYTDVVGWGTESW